MKNVGNSCFINSTIQALFYIPSFVDYLQNDGPNKHMIACRRAGKTNCTICPMIQTLRDCRSFREITPNLILQQMNNICNTMVRRPTGFIQQDAHEYLRYVKYNGN